MFFKSKSLNNQYVIFYKYNPYKSIAHVEFHPPYATIIVLIVLVFIISILMQMYSNKRLVSKNIMLDTRSE